MLSETLVSAILTSSVTGAGLVIAFYALIAKMSDNIFECRFDLLEEKEKEFQRIRTNRDSFSRENLKNSTSLLKELIDEIDSFKTYPKYLKNGIASTFMLFILTTFAAFLYLQNYEQNVTNILFTYTLIAIYLVSIFAFLGIGIYGLDDVNETMKLQFKRLAKRKSELKEEIRQARANQ